MKGVQDLSTDYNKNVCVIGWYNSELWFRIIDLNACFLKTFTAYTWEMKWQSPGCRHCVSSLVLICQVKWNGLDQDFSEQTHR